MRSSRKQGRVAKRLDNDDEDGSRGVDQNLRKGKRPNPNPQTTPVVEHFARLVDAHPIGSAAELTRTMAQWTKHETDELGRDALYALGQPSFRPRFGSLCRIIADQQTTAVDSIRKFASEWHKALQQVEDGEVQDGVEDESLLFYLSEALGLRILIINAGVDEHVTIGVGPLVVVGVVFVTNSETPVSFFYFKRVADNDVLMRLYFKRCMVSAISECLPVSLQLQIDLTKHASVERVKDAFHVKVPLCARKDAKERSLHVKIENGTIVECHVNEHYDVHAQVDLAIFHRITGRVEEEEEEEEDHRIDFPEATFWIQVRGLRESGAIVVDLHHVHGEVKRNVELEEKTIIHSTKLNAWALGLLKIACSSDYSNKEGKSLYGEIVEIATLLPRVPVPVKISVFGRQQLGEQLVFAATPGAIFDLRSGERLYDAFEWEDRLQALPYRPLNHQPGAKGGLCDWVQRYADHYRGVHLSELIVCIAACALAMKRTAEKPIIILHGQSHQGKTPLQRYLAEMFGFDPRTSIVDAATKSGLWDRLNDLSGFPVFLDDPKNGSAALKLLVELVIPTGDGKTRVTKNNQLNANGFLVTSCNTKTDGKTGKDGALENLLQNESVATRGLLIPVRKLPVVGIVNVSHKWKSKPPSSQDFIQDLLRIPEPNGVGPIEGLHPRVGALFGALEHYMEHVTKLARLDDRQLKDLRTFYEDMMNTSRQYQDEKLWKQDEERREHTFAKKLEGLSSKVIEGFSFTMVQADGKGYWLKSEICPDSSKKSSKSIFDALADKFKFVNKLDGHFRKGRLCLAAESVVYIGAKSDAYKTFLQHGMKNTGKDVALICVDDPVLAELQQEVKV